MRRHPSWADAGLGEPAAAVAGHAAATAGASPAQLGAEPGLSDSDGEDTLEAGGVSDDDQGDMQVEVLSPAAAAAAAAATATAAARGRRGPRTYTDEVQGIMRELNVSKLTNVKGGTTSTGAARWSVKLNGEGLLRNSRVLHGESSLILSSSTCGPLVSRVLLP
jgi:hypothetical protein